MQSEMLLPVKIDMWDFVKLKSFCTVKKMIKREDGDCRDWEKIFASCTFDKELLSPNIMNTNSSTVSKQIICLKIDKRPE